MKCPYCNNEMEEGAVISKMVPQWVKKGEKNGQLLSCEKHFTYNEIVAHRCTKCKKSLWKAKENFRFNKATNSNLGMS